MSRTRYYGLDYANRRTPKVVEAASEREARRIGRRTRKSHYGRLLRVYRLNDRETAIAERGGWVPGRPGTQHRRGLGPKPKRKRKRRRP